jgi:hypothetical protein
MKRIKQLIEDHKKCWYLRKDHYIKWRIKFEHRDNMPACCFFLIPTICYNTYPYRQPGWWVWNVYFLHWYISIGEFCNKEKK